MKLRSELFLVINFSHCRITFISLLCYRLSLPSSISPNYFVIH
jgi:hypothetical protein